MGTHDAQHLRSEAEILARSSRPQRNSTWIPKTRDWRYATGVIQHDDYDDAPHARSTWDVMDYEFQRRGSQRHQEHLTRGQIGIASEHEQAVNESTEPAPSPALERAISNALPFSPKVTAPREGPHVVGKIMEFRVRDWRQVKKFKRRDPSSTGEDIENFEATGLVVRIRFRRKNKEVLKEIFERASPPEPTPATILVALAQSSAANRNLTPAIASPGTPAVARTAETIRTYHILDSIESLSSFPLFKRAWVDETYDCNLKFVRSTLRPADKVVSDLGVTYQWYDDAVPADAIFPPGVPLSAKEIHAFYPHHVRWKGVMVRLTNNDYRGAEILGMQAHFRGAPNHHTPPAHMNQYQRDAVRKALPGFKTASYKGKSDRNLRMDKIEPGAYIDSMRKGFSLPTFEDLARGLHRLPSGLDARGLTQCISWYLGIRESFTPKLELNVLHTQSLIRALREPLKPFGPQNLDRNALEEWRSKATFEAIPIEHKERKEPGPDESTIPQRRTQLHLNLDGDDVSMNLTLPIRHTLTFPFLALHGVMGDALRMGIDKAEIRRAARKESEANGSAEVGSEEPNVGNDIADGNDKPSPQPSPEEPKKPYRIPKRVRPEAEDTPAASKKPHHQTPPATSRVYRAIAPAPPRHDSTGPNRFDGSWDAREPSPAFSTPRSAQSSVHGRREFTDRRPEERRDERGGYYGRRESAGPQRERDDGYDSWYGLGRDVDSYRPSR